MVIKEKVAGPSRIWDVSRVIVPLCAGCQHGVVTTLIGLVIEELGIEGRAIAVHGAGCNSLPMSGFDIDRIIGPHGRGPDLATGLKRVHPDAIVFTIQGDGDLLAIGADALMGVLARGEKITIIMYNNSNYSSTGGQMAPTTLMGQVTPTCPTGRGPDAGYPVHGAEMLAGFKTVVYSARGAVNTPANYQATKRYLKTAFQKQMDNIGLSYVEIISACPVQWHMTPLQSLKWVEKIIAEYPLGEFKNVDRIE